MIPVVGSVALAAALALSGGVTIAAAEEAAPAFEAHIDPETGELVERPAGLPRGLTGGQAGGQVATGADGSPLREERGRGGGVSVELRGAFRSTVTATVGSDGQLRTGCDGGQRDSTSSGFPVCE